MKLVPMLNVDLWGEDENAEEPPPAYRGSAGIQSLYPSTKENDYRMSGAGSHDAPSTTATSTYLNSLSSGAQTVSTLSFVQHSLCFIRIACTMTVQSIVFGAYCCFSAPNLSLYYSYLPNYTLSFIMLNFALVHCFSQNTCK